MYIYSYIYIVIYIVISTYIQLFHLFIRGWCKSANLGASVEKMIERKKVIWSFGSVLTFKASSQVRRIFCASCLFGGFQEVWSGPGRPIHVLTCLRGSGLTAIKWNPFMRLSKRGFSHGWRTSSYLQRGRPSTPQRLLVERELPATGTWALVSYPPALWNLICPAIVPIWFWN